VPGFFLALARRLTFTVVKEGAEWQNVRMMKTTNVATIEFIWHDEKALRNQDKHGISFELAARVFLDPHRI